MRTSVVGTGLAALAALALIAGCANDSMPGMQHNAPSTPSTGAQGDHNQADVSFAEQMIPHHQGAIAMAAMVATHTTNPQIRDLATRIQNAQQPEITQMTAWLSRWDGAAATPTSPMPEANHGPMGPMPSGSGMPGMGSMGSVPGMMTPEEMGQLQQANGADFDRMWLQMMIKHHQGAIDMAKTELAQGSNAEAKELAQKIIDAQQAEITQMRSLSRSS
ncbi:DUF305 domain-containing protein [Gandjariella thermophila]|uniref:DUF305 domain-containing protein n=1 Tax=Gandjariella thermophila TaxID=1931992 RepID=A0A4D4JDE9_9PSEU|nr:DUF305 domain-containing protein [Gandjariella thermophila]GDY33432.1 hypothetical protein GTS_50650 [Gandjariella thermophila]